MFAWFRRSTSLLVVLAIASLPNVATAQKEPDVKGPIAQLKDKDEGVRLKAAKELGKL